MDENKKLRLVPNEGIDAAGKRSEREQRARNLQRERELENSVAPFRIGSVKYLNAAPLTRGIEDQIIYAHPSELAEMLKKDELDAALVSVIEVISTGRYDILDGIAIASLNEVKSVLLAHKKPIEQVDVVHCDVASLTSVGLLRVLLMERGLNPRIEPFEDYNAVDDYDYVMLIGDQALDFIHQNHPHQIWDLGSAWYDLTRLPFVFAVWAIRRNIENPERLYRILREARDFGMDTLDYIISSREEYTYDFRKDYLSWHVHFHLGSDERRGLDKFMELLKKHNICEVHPLRFVG